MLSNFFLTLSLPINIVLFGTMAFGLWIAGAVLTAAADKISDELRLGKALVGLIFLAAVTELPEVATTFTAALQDNASLVLNNMFGGIVLQTAILAIADVVARGAPLTFYPRKPTPLLEGSLLAVLLSLLIAIVFVGEKLLLFQVGIGSVVMALLYIGTIAMLRRFDSRSPWVPIEIPDELIPAPIPKPWFVSETDGVTTLMWRFAAAAAVILVLGVLIVYSAETIATQSGLGGSFIGVTFLAAATSLPELSTTIMAVRLRAYTMAISNIFGSNLIMLALLLPADSLYRPGALLANVDKSAQFALICGVIVTLIYVIGHIIRSRRQIFGMGLDSFSVLIVYGLSLIVFYQLR